MRLLQKMVFIKGPEEIRQRVLYRSAYKIFALTMKQPLLAVDIILVLNAK
jgi:hypothetical protein